MHPSDSRESAVEPAGTGFADHKHYSFTAAFLGFVISTTCATALLILLAHA